LVGILIFLIITVAFFSAAETSMMALNRYRIRHLAKQNNRGAKRAEELLKRPDKLLGMVLIGTTCVTFFIPVLGTIIALRLWGQHSVASVTFALATIVIIFSEILPKTLAALYPEKIGLPSTLILKSLMVVSGPFIWLLNYIVNQITKLFGINIHEVRQDHLSPEELHTIVRDGALLPQRRRSMLLSILDLEKSKVEDIMIPRNDVIGIDINDDIDTIIEQISASQHTRLPVYKDDINDIIGILHMRNLSRFLHLEEPTKEEFLKLCHQPYFIPESTPLHTQLFNFQKVKERIGLVVDEYGDVLGIVTLEDILEEIVGQFTSDFANTTQDITPEKDGSYIIAGSANLREINRTLKWDLPSRGTKTLNGLILEMLESIPESSVCLQIDDYLIELLQIKDNSIKSVRIIRKYRKEKEDQETENL
jgi:Mg2+/Co2+ transporter CorB